MNTTPITARFFPRSAATLSAICMALLISFPAFSRQVGEWDLSCVSAVPGAPHTCSLTWNGLRNFQKGNSPMRMSIACGPDRVGIAMASGAPLAADEVTVRTLEGAGLTAKPNSDGVVVLSGDAATKAIKEWRNSVAIVVILKNKAGDSLDQIIVPVPDEFPSAVEDLMANCHGRSGSAIGSNAHALALARPAQPSSTGSLRPDVSGRFPLGRFE